MSDTSQIVNLLQKTAPVLWESVIRQMYINGVVCMILGVLGAIIGGGIAYFSKCDGKLLGVIISVASLLLILIGFLYLSNPTYWAIDAIRH